MLGQQVCQWCELLAHVLALATVVRQAPVRKETKKRERERGAGTEGESARRATMAARLPVLARPVPWMKEPTAPLGCAARRSTLRRTFIFSPTCMNSFTMPSSTVMLAGPPSRSSLRQYPREPKRKHPAQGKGKGRAPAGGRRATPEGDHEAHHPTRRPATAQPRMTGRERRRLRRAPAAETFPTVPQSRSRY